MTEPPQAICVLGCRAESQTLERRARKGAQAFVERPASYVVACGGRAWSTRGAGLLIEADAIACVLIAEGVPEHRILRERCSLDTWDNARFAAALLARRNIAQVSLVTCAWHLPRARRLFERAGLRVEPVPVDPDRVTRRQKVYRTLREAIASGWHTKEPKL